MSDNDAHVVLIADNGLYLFWVCSVLEPEFLSLYLIYAYDANVAQKCDNCFGGRGGRSRLEPEIRPNYVVL